MPSHVGILLLVGCLSVSCTVKCRNFGLKSILVRWTLDFGMDSQQVFGGFGRKGSRLRCFVVKLIWPSWNCGQFDGMYVKIGYAWIFMVTEEVKGSKYFKILEYPPGFG